ncbi:MAG: NfeD family protein [Clostridia bacterium]|nr:NfeD family protein [Clostridia bacterium]
MEILWIAVAIVLIIVESATFNLITIWFALGALCALAAAALGASEYVQGLTFVLSSALLFAVTLPLVKNVLRPKIQATNADRAIGREGVVIEDIDVDEGTGQVKVGGSIWSARSEDGSKIAKNERVEAIRIEGVKLIIRKKV